MAGPGAFGDAKLKPELRHVERQPCYRGPTLKGKVVK